jgi:hypothetical protein
VGDRQRYPAHDAGQRCSTLAQVEGQVEAKGGKDSAGRDETRAEPTTDPEASADELACAPTAVLPNVDEDSESSDLAETAEYSTDALAETVALSGTRTALSSAVASNVTRETSALPVAEPRFRDSELPPAARPAEPRANTIPAPSAAGTPVAVLVPIEGDLLGAVYPLYDGQNSLGRAESNTVTLSSMKISRQQALVIHRKGTFTLHPLSESNPITVDDAVATGCVDLHDGATIRVGLTIFRFRTIEPL